MIEILVSKGFAKFTVEAYLLRFLEFEKMGSNRLYSFSKTPVYIGRFEKLIASIKESREEVKKDNKELTDPETVIKSAKSEEDRCIEYLKSCGYQIRKMKMIDWEKLARENPELVKRYTIFVDV